MTLQAPLPAPRTITNSADALLNPVDCLLAIVDDQSAGAATNDGDQSSLRNLASACRVPILAIHIGPSSRSDVDPLCLDVSIKARTLADPFADRNIEKAVRDYGRNKLILAGFSSEGFVSFTALSGLARGFDIYIVEDLCASASCRAHRTAMQRLVQAGAVLTTGIQLAAEWRASAS